MTEPNESDTSASIPGEKESSRAIRNVLVTGATGFVGRNVVRELLSRGYTPVCLTRSHEALLRAHPVVDPDRLVPILGRLEDESALLEAARMSQAAIHLVGIIIERRLKGKTFYRVHVAGTRRLLHALREAGVSRLVHMSALGTRADAHTRYHKTKWLAEELVRREPDLDRTIFRPSLIHGPDGEFMALMKRFMCSFAPPVVPYFGDGKAKLQPVYVKDVAHCFVEALERPDTIGKTIPLGGPRRYTWIELYNACRALLPGAKSWKPLVSQPVTLAKGLAVASAAPLALLEVVIPSLGLMRFDCGQVEMSQEDNICDHTEAEAIFGIKMRSFEEELALYADRIP